MSFIKQPRSGPQLGVLRKLWTGQSSLKDCGHLDMVRVLQPQTRVCEECVALGDSWPDLRMCMTCGYIGCCDEAKNRHAFKHHQETGHPIIGPLPEDGELPPWMWCYVDEAVL